MLETGSKTPASVSLVMEPCQNATNNLKIIDNQPTNGIRKEFGVCTKYIYFENEKSAFRIIEWVNMLRILGVEKIHGYQWKVHPNISRSIQYYEQKGWMEMKPFHFPQGTDFNSTSLAVWAIERNILNDCFFRNLNLYKYIIVIDTDEIIMPFSANIMNLHDLIKNLDPKESFDHFYFPYVYFFANETHKDDEIPNHLYMMKHIKVQNSDFSKRFCFTFSYHFSAQNSTNFLTILNIFISQ
jgi:hypothetical protein